MKCKKHHKYKGVFKPRVDCEQCWIIYNKQQLNNTTNVKRNHNES